MNDHLWRTGEKRSHVLTFIRSALQRRTPSQRSHFEIAYLNHQAGRGHCSFSDQMLKFFISFDEVDQLGV